MKKFLGYMQKTYNYSDYQIELIKYAILTITSEVSKLIIIFAFFSCIGKFVESLIGIMVLLFLRLSGGGFHCEHYTSCLLTSFSFVFASVALSDLVVIHPVIIAVSMLISIGVAYKMVPVVSFHRNEPSQQLIKQSRKLNFTFLFISMLVTTLFFNSHFCMVIYWTCILHTIQLLLTKIDKKEKYHNTKVR